MSEQRDSSETGAFGPHNIILTPDEKKVFGQLFQAADTENIGVVTGELAVKFFEKSGLTPRILGEIWGIADTENRGLLTKVGFSVALRLIGQAQQGQHPRPELAQQPGPLPRFEGVNIIYPTPTGPATAASPPPPPILPPQATGAPGMIRVPPLLPQDVEKYAALFEKAGATEGILQGPAARDILQRTMLPNATLIQIWNLADRQGRGVLGVAEFVVAMHLVTCSKNGSLPTLPKSLPQGVYDAAAGRPPTRNAPDGRRPPRTMPPVPQIPKQFSGPQSQRAQSPLSRNFTPPVPQNANAIQRDLTGNAWLITPADKQRFDAVFLTVDKTNRGVITGEEAVPFFTNSGLSEAALAQIWDLADITKSGQLNSDEFAIAMYLIFQQRSNPNVPLPDVLPPNLIPPSMRQQRQPTGAPPPGPFDPTPQPPPPPKSAAEDLFGLDSFEPPAQSQVSHPTESSAGSFGADVFGGSKEVSPAPSPATHSPNPPPGSGPFSRPTPTFVPTSLFGQTILASSTGGSSGKAPQQPQQQAAQEMDDLLGDTDPEVSKKLTNETTELANLSNQIGTLTKQTQELNIKRVSAETDLSSLTIQKRNIEVQLVQLREAYEKEAAQVKRVEQQLAISRAETTKVSQDYQRVEAEYNQMQYKKQELSSQLEADKRENENLKERMNVINSDNRNLKEELEKLELQVRRERGMVAINKKQVEKSEQEREKLKGGIEDANRSLVASPVPPASPTLSQASVSHNPFHRKSPENNFGSNSPFASKPAAASMDDVFGPAFSSTPPPPTSFSTKSQLDSSSYTPSVPESGHGGRSTPPTSPPGSSYQGSPRPSESIPPPVSSQITAPSAYFPLPISRADSVTSSVQVQPSASVRDTQFSRPDTPTNVFGSVTSDSPARDRDAKLDDRRNSFSVKSDAGTDSGKPAFSPFDRRNDSPFAPVERNTTGTTSGGDENRPKLEKTDSMPNFSTLPGAFPTASSDNGAPIKPTPTGESTLSNRSRTSNASRGFGPVDPFGLGKEENRSGTASSKDLDDAFRPFPKVDPHHTGGSGSISNVKFHDEFPPIEEVRPESDSDSEAGFEDNFTAPAAAAATAPTTSDNADKLFNEFGGLLPSPAKFEAPPPDEFDDAAFGDLAEAKEADDAELSSAFDGYDPVFDAPKPSTATTADNGFGDFSFEINEPPKPAEPTPAPVQAATSEDWDAIFANFGEQPAPPQQENAGNGTTEQVTDKKELTNDEKVEKLTGMGFEREKAINALEKNAGNIDQAADSLISETA